MKTAIILIGITTLVLPGMAETALQIQVSPLPAKPGEFRLFRGDQYENKKALDKPGDRVSGKTYFEYKLKINRPGAWVFWSAGYPTDKPYTSPFSWAVDASEFREVRKEGEPIYNEQGFCWTKMGEAELTGGNHVLKILAIVGRKEDGRVIHENEYYLVVNDQNYRPFAPDKLDAQKDVWMEGEDFVETLSSGVKRVKDNNRFGGAWAVVYTREKPKAGVYRAEYELNIPDSGNYSLWILSYPFDYRWSFDTEAHQVFKDRAWTNRQIDQEDIWYKVASRDLKKGKHSLNLQVSNPREDGYYLLMIDAILLTRNPTASIIPLNVSSKAKYRIQFPQVRKGNIFQPGEDARVGMVVQRRLEDSGFPGEASLDFFLKDGWDKQRSRGKVIIEFKNGFLVGGVELKVNNPENGFYSLEGKLREKSGREIANQTTLAVLPKEEKGDFNPQSLFGAAINYLEPQDPSLPLMRRVGVKTIRTSLEWKKIQPEKNVWVWEKYDRIVEDAGKYKFNLLFFFYTTPEWASSAPKTARGEERNYYPPQQDDDWGNFVYAAVNRYKNYVTQWEIWNEPWPNGYAWHADSEAYRKLVQTACRAAKRADPACRIAAYDWPNQLYKGGYAPFFNAGVIHPYDDRNPKPEQGFLEWCKVHTGLAREYGKETWITEHGWGWCEERQKADYLVRGYTLALACGVTKYCWFDFNAIFAKRGWALMNPDLTPRVGFVAYNTLTSMLEKKRFLRSLNHKPDGWCYFFHDPGTEKGVAVIWSTGKKKLNLYLEKGLGEVYDIMYRPLGKTETPVQKFVISESPIFIQTDNVEKLIKKTIFW